MPGIHWAPAEEYLEVLAEPRLAQVLREFRRPGWWVLRVLLEQPQELGELEELEVFP